MAISSVQQGIVTQNEFAKLLMMTSDGRIEVNPPKVDDDKRDFEVHRKGVVGRGLSVQVKSVLRLYNIGHHKGTFSVFIASKGSRPRGRRNFYFFFGLFDLKEMRFRDPVFLVPSLALYRLAKPRYTKRRWHLNFLTNLDSNSHDKWVRYRLLQKDLGRTLLKLLQ